MLFHEPSSPNHMLCSISVNQVRLPLGAYPAIPDDIYTIAHSFHVIQEGEVPTEEGAYKPRDDIDRDIDPRRLISVLMLGWKPSSVPVFWCPLLHMASSQDDRD